VPIHTSVLLDTREQALRYPRADLRLCVCEECGLVTNAAFDALGHDYSASYLEVQAFSPRFREYLSELARVLVERHALEGRDVVEVGCGRGDFLLELCARTGAAGLGIDPSFRESRLEGPAAERVAVVRAFFAPEHVPAGTAALLCRHTLEHVHDVGGFLAAVRAGLERAPDAVVVLEVPDTNRVLRQTAFWDLFYEHCSYFTPGSLARSLRRAGLVPTRLERMFDDQYLLVTASAGRPGEGAPLPLEEEPGEVVELAMRFAREVRGARERWGELLRAARARGETAVIWGAGSKGVGFLTMLRLADEIAYAVDVNPAKHGMFMPGTGHEIVAPEMLVAVRPSIVVVMNPAYRAEIARDLAALGVEAELLAV
jgi:SAM-dependent methyltransferase